jgi:hypothetical protein
MIDGVLDGSPNGRYQALAVVLAAHHVQDEAVLNVTIQTKSRLCTAFVDSCSACLLSCTLAIELNTPWSARSSPVLNH